VNQQLQALRLELEAALKERDETSAIVAQLEAEKAAQPTGDAAMTDGPEDGELSDTQAVAEQPVSSDAEKKAIEQRAVAAEARVKELEVRVKEREDRVSELEARVKELEARIKDMEDTNETVIKQRSEKMKQILNKKLVESREAAKAALEAEFAEKLQTEKQAWLTEHATSNSTVTETAAVVEKPKEESVAASNPPATPATPAKTQPGLPANVDLANLGDEQTRALLMSNQTVKSILASNIRKKVEEEAKKLREEHDKKSTAELDQLRQDLEKEKEELLKKADEAKAQALNMESKRVSVKLNMADNRAKLATAKLGVVEKAATDTPQRPVVEVWQEVKTFKLPPAAAAATAATPAPNAPGSVSAITAGTSTIPKPQGAPAVSGIRPPSVSVPAATAVAGAAGQQSRPSTPAQPQTAGPTQTTGGTSPNAVQQAAPAHANQPANGSALPVVSPDAPIQTLPGSPLTSPSQPSQIPQAPGGAPRTGIPRGGSNIARGRGGTYQAPRGGGQSGIGRGRGGGNQRGGMNPAAHNFHPGAGNKRPHDESGGPQGGQGQKRMKGGAQGGN
jgi:nucleoprotein TPR